MIKFLIDSSSDYMQSELAGEDILFIPMGITLNGKDYLGGVDLNQDQFYDMLVNSSEFPKTSMPSPAAFTDYFEKAKANGDEIICIILSSALSGTYQSAVTAKAMVGYEGIHLIDSRCAAACIRIMLEHALRLRADGLSAAEITQQLELLKKRIRVYAAVDTLEYLYKGGRLSRAAAAVGTIASLKPILTITEEGTVSVIKKSLSKNRAQRDLLDILTGADIDTSFPVYTLYSCGVENCEALEEHLAEAGIFPTGRTQLGPAIGAHVGPGVYGMFFVEKDR